MNDDKLVIAGIEYSTRLWVGTGKGVEYGLMRDCIKESGAEIVTVAIRRIPQGEKQGEAMLDYLDGKTLLPNTAMCYTAKDAILTAQLAREALGTDLVKLEVIGDEKTLFPDNEQLLEAARVLVGEGFTVLPYCIDDPIICRKLEEIGCAAVMPLAGTHSVRGLAFATPPTCRSSSKTREFR
jgi:thiazole synthase